MTTLATPTLCSRERQDRLGSRLTYALSLGLWSMATMVHGLMSSVAGLFSARLALILAHSGSEGLKLKWRLANDEISTAERVLAAAHLLIDFRINEAAYRQPAVLADAVEVATALAGWTEAGKGAVVQRLTGVDVAPLPINGTDLIHAGLRPGPGLGVELGRLEKLWIDSDFQLSREALLQAIKRPSPHP